MPSATFARLLAGRVSPACSCRAAPGLGRTGGDGLIPGNARINLMKSTESSPYMCAADVVGLKKGWENVSGETLPFFRGCPFGMWSVFTAETPRCEVQVLNLSSLPLAQLRASNEHSF